ncbi:MAG: DUF58 domain-containing protein [Thermomicrobiales bacterium]
MVTVGKRLTARSHADGSPTRWARFVAWWNNPAADVDIRRWAGIALVIGVLGALLREPILLLLALMIFLAGLIARVWWDHSFTNLTVAHAFSTDRAFYGDEVTLTITVKNEKPLPITRFDVAEEVTTNVQLVGHDLARSERPDRRVLRSIFSLGMYERVSHRYRIPAHRRGWYRFGPVQMTAVDPFGIVTRRQMLEETHGFLAYPRTLPVSTLVVPARQPYGDHRPQQQVIEDPMRFAGVRPYVPGDSPRRIHWRASARVGELQTRTFEPTASPVAAIFLDTITFSYLWEGQDSGLLELAITVAASLSSQMLAERNQVGIYVNAPIPGRTRVVRVPPGRRPGQLTRILESLAMLTPAFGDRIEHVIVEELPRLPWGAAIVIVTCRVTESLQRSLLRIARSSGSQRCVLVVVGDDELELVAEVRKRVAIYRVSSKEAWDVIDHITLDRVS